MSYGGCQFNFKNSASIKEEWIEGQAFVMINPLEGFMRERIGFLWSSIINFCWFTANSSATDIFEKKNAKSLFWYLEGNLNVRRA